jgi:hypothetical protein
MRPTASQRDEYARVRLTIPRRPRVATGFVLNVSTLERGE